MRTYPNTCRCPNCRADGMSEWRPLDAAMSGFTGNHFYSRCRGCGAIEQRPKTPLEVWDVDAALAALKVTGVHCS